MNEATYRIANRHEGDAVVPTTSQEVVREVVLGDNFSVGAGVWARTLEVTGPGIARGPLFARDSMMIHVPALDPTERRPDGKRQLLLGGISVGGTLTCEARGEASPLDGQIPLGIKGEVVGEDVSLHQAVVLGNVTCTQGRIRDSVVMGSVVAREGLELSNCVCFSAKAGAMTFGGKVSLFLPFLLSTSPFKLKPDANGDVHSLLTSGDVRWGDFIQRVLADQKGGPRSDAGRHLWKLLDREATATFVAEARRNFDSPEAEASKALLAQILNEQILKQPEFHASGVFKLDIGKAGTDEEMDRIQEAIRLERRRGNLTGEEVVRLNRLLLEMAYPTMVVKSSPKMVRCLPVCATPNLGCAAMQERQLSCPLHIDGTCPHPAIFMEVEDQVQHTIKGKPYHILTQADRLLNMSKVLEMARNQASLFKRALLADLLTRRDFDAMKGEIASADRVLLEPILSAVEDGLPETSAKAQDEMEAYNEGIIVEDIDDYDDEIDI